MKEKLAFSKALQVLECLMKGKSQKETARELKIQHYEVSRAKSMFPLFLGLRDRRGRKGR